MLIQIAWKNIWRNKVRSSVILAAIALGIFAGLFNMAFYYGMADQRIETAIKTEASHIQIHQTGYLNDPDTKNHMENGNAMTERINSDASVKHAAGRMLVNAMVSSAESGSGVRILGIHPGEEKQVTNMYTRVSDGEYLTGIKRNPILIGEKLAEKLDVRVRSKIVLTMQNVNGEMMYVSFRVAGIYKVANSTYEESTAFVRISDLSGLLGLENSEIHEVAILLRNNEDLDPTTERLKQMYPDKDIKSWKEIMPEVGLIEESMNVSMYIFMGIILLALLFGIINTMLMAVLERRKELGMLMAVGMNKMRVFRMIMYETVLLSLVGGIVGIILGGLFTMAFSKQGIDLSNWGQAYGSMGYDTLVYPVLEISMGTRVVFMVLVTGFLAALYPAWKALKLKPAEAIRIDI